MTDTNKSYRIRTKIGNGVSEEYLSVNADLLQDYDTFEVLSVTIKSKDAYQLQNSNYGVIVGRVLANNGFGIPNAKISIFIQADNGDRSDMSSIYPFNTTVSKNKDGVRYNLLPNERVDGCHQVVGSFPSKRYALDNDVVLEVFDKYYTYTTKTNNSGDYMICGVPVGAHTIHMDLDLSDCGVLSQKPRDFVYKGYTVEQFESPTKFKGGTDYNNLSQIFTQDQVVNVNPFWGNTSLGETIGITRCDINVNFKFEPTCIFMGSIVSDNSSNGFSKRCKPTENMGNMDELVTGEGKIEMIRKTPGGSVEQFQVKGEKLINANGVWCYQIPMNLDYIVTDEYGNMVPTDNPEIGIPTRTSVRFRISMEDTEENTDNFFRGKVLVPHNPQMFDYGSHEPYDYEFGTYTKEESFRDLFWNNVYSVKSYIPRIQRSNNWKRLKFSGIKHCNIYGPNNPMPYNNIRIKLPLLFTIMCAILKCFVFITKLINSVIAVLGYFTAFIGTRKFFKFNLPKDASWWNFRKIEISWAPIFPKAYDYATKLKMVVLKDGLCPDLENWFFSPIFDWAKAYLTGKPIFDEDGNKTSWYYGYALIKKSKNQNGVISGSFLCGCDEEENPPLGNGSQIGNENGEEPENWEYIPCSGESGCSRGEYNLLLQTIRYVLGVNEEGQEYEHDKKIESIDDDDPNSIDDQNADPDDETHCLTTKTDYLLPCIEMNLAQEYKVINFDFYNDWINGVIYNPRWVRYKKGKVRFLWITWSKEKIKGCMDDPKIFSKNRKYVQQCAIGYEKKEGSKLITDVQNPITPGNTEDTIIKSNNYHKGYGFRNVRVFGKKGGICHEKTTLKGQKVYYLKPCEFIENGRKINLYATDIILLGTFNDCDLNGIPQTFQHLTSTTYVMPTNLALTNMDSDGALYATDDGTICLGNTEQGVDIQNSASTLNDGISVVDIINKKAKPLEAEIKYTLNSPDDISDNSFEWLKDGDTYNDTIAITEAAGIAWNYTGPGQGKPIPDNMYYPGGHFLGMSCVNSQTNIKSCINLSRICEIGTNMSQRHENVRAVGNNGLSYIYSVPTGFISGDDISDRDFRTMFSTLNKKRLKATKRDKSTGYLTYDFEFSYPINFDGSFRHMVYDKAPGETVNPYNQKIYVEEEDLTEYGDVQGNVMMDYDAEETANTQTRTREVTSEDYYAFRLGIENNKLNNQNLIERKYLIKDEDKYYLPQYENSYYFYFGLKNGATALDEFNKQFYAVCDDLKIKKAPNIIVNSDITNFCEGKGKIRVMTEGLSLPYSTIEVYGYQNDITLSYTIGSRPEYDEELSVLMQETFYLPYEHDLEHEFDFGNYRITITDDDGVEVTGEVVLGLDLFNYNLNIVDFTCPISEYGVSEYQIFNGGFVLVENFSSLYSGGNINYEFILRDDNENEIGFDEYIDYPDNGVNWHVIYGDNKNEFYSLYLRYRCGDEDDYVNIKIIRFIFSDNSKLNLRIGSEDNYKEPLFDDSIMSGNSYSWWWNQDYYDVGCDNILDDADRWFYRKMFLKESNNGTFDSRVRAYGGTKVVWGVPQTRNTMLTINGWQHIYCSEKQFDLPSGTYLDDTLTIRPTYGVNDCGYVGGGNNNRDVNGNCTYNYCAQAYNNDNQVAGDYCIKYDRNDHYVEGRLSERRTDDFLKFHEGYGCVFKPLPYGQLIFMEYSDANSMIDAINSATTAIFGVIYPTFIYPVIKRPFYVDFKMVIWGNTTAMEYMDGAEKKYSILYDEFGSKSLLNVHNGVTYNRWFSNVIVQGNDYARIIFNNSTRFSGDTYGVTETESHDRISTIDTYTDLPLNDEAVNISIKEKSPYTNPNNDDDMYSEFLLERNVNSTYGFLDNMSYSIDSMTNKIDYVSAYNWNDQEYYIGVYNPLADGIDFIESRSFIENGKYAYYNISGSKYAVICRFKEVSYLPNTIWGRVVVVYFSQMGAGRWRIRYNFINKNGEEKTYDNIVPLYGYYTTNPYNINEALDNLNNNNNPFLPFTPILNYKLKEHVTINNIEYKDFEEFLHRLITNGNLVPIEKLSYLREIDLDNDFVFGIGVKTIQSSENDEVFSKVFKVYPSLFKQNNNEVFNDEDYEIMINPDPEEYADHYNIFRSEDNIEFTVEVNAPCLLLFEMVGNGSWCEYRINGRVYENEYEMDYEGGPVNVVIHAYENETDATRNCDLVISSYYGELKDSASINIVQSNVYNTVDITASNIEIGAGGMKTIQIPYSSDKSTIIGFESDSPSWAQITGQTGNLEINGNTNYNLEVYISKYNNSPVTRTAKISFLPINGNDRDIYIIQDGYLTNRKINITIKKHVEGHTDPTNIYNSSYIPSFDFTVNNVINGNNSSIHTIIEEDGKIQIRYHLTGQILTDDGNTMFTETIDETVNDTLTHGYNGNIYHGITGYTGNVYCDSFELLNSNLDYEIVLNNNASWNG